MTNCMVCDAEMAPVKEWYGRCPSCKFMMSSLEAGSGAEDVLTDSIEELRNANFDRLIKLLAKHGDIKGKRVLEVGCARGLFLQKIHDEGATETGIEPDAANACVTREKGLNVKEGFFPDVLAEDEGKYDMVVFNDVFEHLPDPKGALAACAGILKPGGLLVLNIPSSKGVFYRVATILARFGVTSLLDRLWQKGMHSPHLTYFNPQNLKRFVGAGGDFVLQEESHLKTFALTGLKKRIAFSVSEPIASLMYVGLVCAYPVFAVMPKDICLQIFERKS